MLVTIVTPAYRCESFITNAVESVRAQSHRPLQHVVVDDGSPDRTADVVATLAQRAGDPGYSLRLIRHDGNQGAAQALATGMDAADGEVVCWLSADDAYIDASKTERQLQALKRSDVVFDTQWRTGPSLPESTILRTQWPPLLRLNPRLRRWDPGAVLLGLMFSNPLNGSSVMLRRNVLAEHGGFDPSLGNVDADGDLWMRYSAAGVRFFASDACSVYYRIHPEQTSQRRDHMVVGTNLTRLRVLSVLKELGLLEGLLQRHSTELLLAIASRLYLAFPYAAESLLETASSALPSQSRYLPTLAQHDIRRSGLLQASVRKSLDEALLRTSGSSEIDRFRRLMAGGTG